MKNYLILGSLLRKNLKSYTMTSIQVKFRPSALSDYEGTVYYQIIHERKVRHLNTPYRIFSSEWDTTRSMLYTTPDSQRRELIHSMWENIQRDLERFSKIGRRLDAERLSYSVDDIVCEFQLFTARFSLFNFMEEVIAELRQNDKLRTAETYLAALNSFKKFHKGEDVLLDCLSSEMMMSYEAWLQARGLTPNSISFYTRILRAVYNRAVDKGIIENRNPFRKVYTGIEKTMKRALPLSAIRKIKALDLSQESNLDFARDMFLLSFFLRGMSLVDMAFLKKSDLNKGILTYRRRKTGQKLHIKWTKEMQSILNKYPAHESHYLLPILRDSDANPRNAYRNKSYNINYSLKKIASKVGLKGHLTFYMARHSWASAAKTKGIPVSVISEGMGHGSENTTRIYLASLDTSTIDRANALILSSI